MVVRGTVVLLAGGVLSFGAVYPWAFWPLAAGAQVVGIAGLWLDRKSNNGVSRAFALSLLLLAAVVITQLVPVPLSIIDQVSPETSVALRQLDPAFAIEASHLRALSIAPPDTLIALGLYGSFALLMVGTSRVLSRVSAEGLCAGLIALGVVVALVGIIQKSLYVGRIYGFWQPSMPGDVFGPFVNRNHFAGWMLLAIPLCIGLLLSRIARALRGVAPVLRERLLWFASADASKSILIAAGVVVMALSLVLTMSRSGVGALAFSILLAGSFVMRKSGAVTARFAGIAYLIVLVVVVAGGAGFQTLTKRFEHTTWKQVNERVGAWSDAVDVAKRFPLVGTGLNTYGTAMLLYQRHDKARHYAEAHNDYLQLLAEGGALLAIPVVLCVGLFTRDVLCRFREDRGSAVYWIRAGAVIGLIAIGLQSAVDFSLQMPANAALFAVVCGVALHKSPSRMASSGRLPL